MTESEKEFAGATQHIKRNEWKSIINKKLTRRLKEENGKIMKIEIEE